MRKLKTIFIFALWLSMLQAKAQSLDPVLDFIKAQPNKSAILLLHDGEPKLSRQIEEPMPVAGLYGILVAIAYCNQAANGELNHQELVPLAFIKRFDNGKTGFDIWEKYLHATKRISNEQSVTLEEMIKGMLSFNVDAITDYFFYRIGTKNINDIVDSLGLPYHQDLVPPVSSWFLCHNHGLTSIFPFVRKIESMGHESFVHQSDSVLQQLANDDSGYYKMMAMPRKHSPQLSEAWSRRLPHASAETYAELMQMLNLGEWPDSMRPHLRSVFEAVLMEDTENSSRFLNIAFKTGATPTVLSVAAYVTDKSGNAFAFACLLEGLDTGTYNEMSAHLNKFSIRLLTDTTFRHNVINFLQL